MYLPETRPASVHTLVYALIGVHVLAFAFWAFRAASTSTDRKQALRKFA